MTIDDAIRIALRQNPDVAIARSMVDSARAEHHIARAFPNPVLAGTPNTPYQYSATMPLDIMPQRIYRVRAAALGSAASDLDRRDVERQTSLAVARAYLDALLAEERLKLMTARAAIVAQLLCADSLRFKAGDVPERNVVRSEVELTRADADVERASAAVRTGRIALAGTMGLDSLERALTLAGSLDYKPLQGPSDSLIAFARRNRSDFRAAETRVAQSGAARSEAASLLLPTPQLAYVRQFTGPFDNGHYYSFGLAFELPSLNLYRGQRERAAAGAVAAEINDRRVAAQIDRDVSAAATDFSTQRALVERYTSGLLAKIDGEVSALQYAYQHGAASLLEVLDAVQAQQDTRADYLAALHDYWVSVYTLNAAVGADIFGLPR